MGSVDVFLQEAHRGHRALRQGRSRTAASRSSGARCRAGSMYAGRARHRPRHRARHRRQLRPEPRSQLIPFEASSSSSTRSRTTSSPTSCWRPGTSCRSSTTTRARRRRASFVARFCERPFFFIRAATPQVLLDEVEKVALGRERSMRAFAYERPASLAEATRILADAGPEARRPGRRHRPHHPAPRRDHQPERGRRREAASRSCDRASRSRDGVASVSAGTSMTDIAADERMRRHFPALVEAAVVVGSVQIRNRATLAGNVCNASPAADTAPPLLVYGAVLVIARSGRRAATASRRRSSCAPARRTLERRRARHRHRAPIPTRRPGATHVRRTRRRGHDLASVTLCCAVDDAGVTRIAYGSVGTAAAARRRRSGVLADPTAAEVERAAASSKAVLRGRKPLAGLDAREPGVPAGDAAACSASRALRTARARLDGEGVA